MSDRKGFTAKDADTGWIAMSDLISRKALCEFCLNTKDRTVDANDIMRFPSAEPERKKGEWVKEDLSGYLTPGGNSIYHCSECGHTEGPYPHPRLTDFCPNCGAEMRGDR